MIGNDGVSNDLQPVSLERTRSPEVFHLVFRLLSKHRCFRRDISIYLVNLNLVFRKVGKLFLSNV